MKRMVKAILPLITALSIFSSCNKSEVENVKNIDATSKLSNRSAGDNEFDLLGYGYDVTGLYASSSSSTYKVIDIVKMSQLEPDRIVPDLNVSEYFEYHAGANAYDYTSDLSQDYSLTTGFLVFKSSIKANFKEKNVISSKYSYATTSKVIKQKRLKFAAPIELIRANYLNNTFKSEVLTMTPQQIVAKYGTHVLSDIILGAKLDVHYKAQSNNSNREETVKAGVNVNGLFKIFDISADVSSSTTLAKANYDQSIYYSTVGGDGTKALIGEITFDPTGQPSQQKIDIQNWQSSCTKENAALIQIGQNGLIPIWDLIDNTTKRAAVKAYVEQYMINNSLVNAAPIYRFYSSKYIDHYYSKNGATPVDYTFEKFAFGAYLTQQANAVPVYRYVRPGVLQDHFYTTTYKTYANYNYEGIEFYAYKTQVAGTIPVYGYYEQNKLDHFYTTDPSQEDLTGYVSEGIVFYVFP